MCDSPYEIECPGLQPIGNVGAFTLHSIYVALRPCRLPTYSLLCIARFAYWLSPSVGQHYPPPLSTPITSTQLLQRKRAQKLSGIVQFFVLTV